MLKVMLYFDDQMFVRSTSFFSNFMLNLAAIALHVTSIRARNSDINLAIIKCQNIISFHGLNSL